MERKLIRREKEVDMERKGSGYGEERKWIWRRKEVDKDKKGIGYEKEKNGIRN